MITGSSAKPREGGRAVIDAIVNGKLSREQENMEDLLTSCVFGLLTRVSPKSAGEA